MGKFDQQLREKTTREATTNYESGLAFKMDAASELYSRVGTCLVNEPKFYGDVNEELKRILELISII